MSKESKNLEKVIKYFEKEYVKNRSYFHNNIEAYNNFIVDKIKGYEEIKKSKKENKNG